MKLPLWLKILLIFMPFMLIATVLEAVSQFVIPPIVIFAFMLFPGPDREAPRLVRWIPWFWGLEMLTALVLFFVGLAGKNLFPPEARPPTQPELWGTIIFAVPMIWSLLKRNKFFRPLLIIQAIVGIGISFWLYSESPGDFKGIFELSGGVTEELMLTVYLLAKVKIPNDPS